MKHTLFAIIALLLVACSGAQDDAPGAQLEADSGAAPVAADSGGLAGCGLHTGFPGDGACLLDASSTDIVLHYGPSNYDDPAEVARYTMAPGGESVTCAIAMQSHPALLVSSYEVSERPGMHHFGLFTGAPNATPDPGCGSAGAFVLLAQRSHELQQIAGVAPEYADAAMSLPAGSFTLQAHAINTSDTPALVEGWIRLSTVPATLTPLAPMVLTAGHKMAVAPHSRATITGAAPAIELPMTVVSLVGHFHAHTSEERVTVNGAQVYDTSSWSEPSVAWFTSRTSPLVVPPAAVAPAGYTGPRVGSFILDPATSLQWACDVDNTTDLALTYGNKVNTAEMCNLQGLVKGARPWTISLP